ncbi:DUF1820 family protein [Pseudobacteriovorax antillogorgiicola]|uniref:DUF1820 family protein n=1 Tax=Pseudobacteriovorax antillogorgiicola TaxID=1513793 RepID=A0A1Y6C9R4_9BACT|nr:DUF1820 family protein [Pseudobacteriovorax antillogorgiicola]TCS51802.1 hypothetical protein EDD56_110187 [Pseudobacteriovorax antillogorgiicola]SMF50091.1 hypothetical protein SAMN06296036_115156 [Pseudobacteriovorax antillogorgiicola]
MDDQSIYKVRFRENDKGDIREALVREVYPSDIPGLVTLSEFVFRDNTKKIIMPEEDATSKRFRKTLAIHIPYHNILFVEELLDEPVDLKNLPFLSEIKKDSQNPQPQQ